MNALTESPTELAQTSSLFFVLSGEHASLPAAEVKAVLESSNTEYEAPAQSYRLLTMRAPQRALKFVAQRSLMYNSCGVVLGECSAEEQEIAAFVKNLALEQVTTGAANFAVRAIRLGGVNRSMRRVNVEREVGSLLSEVLPKMRVQLERPDLTFTCILFEDRFLLGLSGGAKPSGLIAPRRPRKRPVFHPSTMPPKIARCMVNLARAKPGATFVDPFCGVGGITIEASVIGCRTIAGDASLRMLRGARRNLNYFGLASEGFLRADARRLPLQGLEAAATDPPYGRGSSTMGSKVTTLVREFLVGAKDLLKNEAHLCISVPVEVDVESYAEEAGFSMKERHLVRVHRSLTRQFVVLQNS